MEDEIVTRLFNSDFYNFMTNSPITNILIFALIIVIVLVYRSWSRQQKDRSNLTENLLRSLNEESKMNLEQINHMINAMNELKTTAVKIDSLVSRIENNQESVTQLRIQNEKMSTIIEHCRYNDYYSSQKKHMQDSESLERNDRS